jgi:hypothetical protein
VRRTAAATAAVALAAIACGRNGDAPRTEPDPEPTQDSVPASPIDPARQPAVVLTTAGGDEVRVLVEVVRTPRERARGLMYRQHLPPDRGMLFLFEQEEIQSFWMKNTLIPLDMVFIRRDMTVAGIVENAEPRTTSSRRVDAPSIYVLEVNGGWTAARGVRAGAAVRFENVDAP